MTRKMDSKRLDPPETSEVGNRDSQKSKMYRAERVRYFAPKLRTHALLVLTKKGETPVVDQPRKEQVAPGAVLIR